MTAIYFDRIINDDARRRLLFSGDIFVYSANKHSLALIDLAKELIADAFPGMDPRTAQHRYDVKEFASILAKLKPAFIHHPECKRIIPRMLEAIGCDLDKVHFDIPRMRTSTSSNYLTTGISYAFHPHRDTWYAAPMCQVNWWLPIFDFEADSGMAFHPNYFDRSVLNGSDSYDYQQWNAKMRFNAADHIGTDPRPQPRAQEQLLLEPRTVVVTPPGGMLLFSAAQMHSSMPNQTGQTRFSIDFRCVHLSDLMAREGARNLDSKCTGSAINDYLQASNLTHVSAEVQELYLEGHRQPIAP